ncbi:MAG: ABC transporter ATP-binding protein, partial [Prochlorococcaceae cyanobacterium ETNP18_MAG_14]|nr:ABC transporter ATP-binding protein [Prochlorococcaceae cyanobacterium ETNP18_MAG_14]
MVLRTVKKLCHRKQDPLTAIWITHRLEELDHADGAARMENGKIGQWISGKQLRRSISPLAVRQV